MKEIAVPTLLALLLVGCSASQAPQPSSADTHVKQSTEGSSVSHVIYFEHDSSTPPDNALEVIEPHIEALIRQPRRKLLILGSADPSGELNYNLELSLSRAEAIKSLFVKEGISATQLITTSATTEFPYWPGINPSERRRVTLIY